MSYRAYIGKISNEKYILLNKIKTEEELNQYLNIEDNFDFFQNIEKIDEISDETLHLNEECESFFENKNLNRKFNTENDLFIINKEKLLKIIDIYEKKIQNYYKNKFEEIQKIKNEEKDLEYALDRALYDIRVKISDWNGKSLDKSENKYRITKSWLIEYNIFDLMNIYKNFDFDNNKLVIYAY